MNKQTFFLLLVCAREDVRSAHDLGALAQRHGHETFGKDFALQLYRLEMADGSEFSRRSAITDKLTRSGEVNTLQLQPLRAQPFSMFSARPHDLFQLEALLILGLQTSAKDHFLSTPALQRFRHSTIHTLTWPSRLRQK